MEQGVRRRHSMKEEYIDEIRDCIEEAVENVLEEKIADFADEIRDAQEMLAEPSV